MKNNKKKWLIWTLLIIGFCAMEFPGVLFFGKQSEPFIFGMPFIYGYILCWWAYMCFVFLLAYRLNWGKSRTSKSNFVKSDDD